MQRYGIAGLADSLSESAGNQFQHSVQVFFTDQAQDDIVKLCGNAKHEATWHAPADERMRSQAEFTFGSKTEAEAAVTDLIKQWPASSYVLGRVSGTGAIVHKIYLPGAE